MKAVVEPSEPDKLSQLEDNLRKRVESMQRADGSLVVEVEDLSLLERTPGVAEFETPEGDTIPGIGGSPVDEQVYARLESREDAVRCLLATVGGYDLVVLETTREWDLRRLKRFNPRMKHLKRQKPAEELGVERALFEAEGLEKVEVEMPEPDEVVGIYREKLT
ncbi:MAG: hypothetical protein ABEJ03_02190 [Candidatus Nanohaloarchaea archaeon]